MAVQHHRFDSDIIEDTPAAILEQILQYQAMLANLASCVVFIQVPLTIERIRRFEDGKPMARVFARWSVLGKLDPVPLEAAIFGIAPSGAADVDYGRSER